jgi:transcriptional regulator with XRE-family HTH domain/nitroreductase
VNTSSRVFLRKPVPEATVRDILVRAARMSSTGESIPWRVYAIAGRHVRVLEAELTGRPQELVKGKVKARRLQITKRLQDHHLFGAPIVLFFAIERYSQAIQWADLGKYVHTSVLLARRRGLQTFQLESSILLRPAVRSCLKLSKNLTIHSGVALGYADIRATPNSEFLPRGSIDNFATFQGFGDRQTLDRDKKKLLNTRLGQKNSTELPSKRVIKPADRYVGERIYARRIILGLTQTEIAKRLEISYQLFQKYESGATRVGASRLQQLASALEVPVDYFFKKTSTDVDEHPSKDLIPSYISEFLASPDGIRLLKAFVCITNRKLRRSLVAFIEEAENQ